MAFEKSVNVDELLTGTMDRRRMLRLMGGAGAAALLGVALKAVPASAAGSHYQTVTSLNLRAKPSTKGKILLVLPLGAKVREIGEYKNGYYKVEYNGTTGWAHGDYLAPTSADAAPPITGSAATNDSVNFRQGPDLGDPVIEYLPAGTTVETSDTVVDGFRHVRYDGVRGWVWDDYLGGYVEGIDPGQTLTVTSNLNLREQPSTSAKVFTVMPKGSQVTAGAQSENGFRVVYYGSIGGWASEAYLA